jgi:hypothetical protein
MKTNNLWIHNPRGYSLGGDKMKYEILAEAILRGMPLELLEHEDDYGPHQEFHTLINQRTPFYLKSKSPRFPFMVIVPYPGQQSLYLYKLRAGENPREFDIDNGLQPCMEEALKTEPEMGPFEGAQLEQWFPGFKPENPDFDYSSR